MATDGNTGNEESTDETESNEKSTIGKERTGGRRTFLKATGGTALAATVAGCLSLGGGGSGGSNSEANGSGGGSSDSTNSGGNNSAGTGSGGTATGSSSAIDGPITIGALAPDPENDPIGGSIINAAKLAVQELNDDGGIGGANVELATGDTKADPSTGQQRYRELVLNKNADVTTGIFTSEVLLNIMDDIAQQQKLHLTAGAATTKASRMVATDYEKYKYHFRAGPLNDVDLGKNLIDFGEANFENMGWGSTYGMIEDYAWTKPITKLFKQNLGETGAKVAGNQRYASGTEDFGPLYDSVESSDATGMFAAMAHTGTAAVVQWAKQQRPFGFAGIHVPMQLPSYYESVNGACLYGVTQTSATPKSEVTKKTQPFVKAYNKRFDSYPVYTGYITYDAIKAYAAMVEKTGTTDADKLVSAMEDASYTATTGTLEFYGKDKKYPHDPVYSKDAIWPVFLQWQKDGNGGGVQEVIWPEQYKTADYKQPAWI